MTAQGIRIPFGIADPAGERIYVRGETGRLELLDARTGDVLAGSELAADPLGLAGTDLVACAAPTPWSPGEIVLVDTAGDLAVRWSTPLLDPQTHHAVAAGLDDVHVEVEFERDAVVVTTDIRASYHGGAPPPDDVLAAATVNQRRVLRLDRSTGEPLDLATRELPPGVGRETTRSDATATVSDQLLDRVEEIAPSGIQRRYLRSRDPRSGATRWSRLIEEVEPRLPPPPAP